MLEAEDINKVSTITQNTVIPISLVVTIVSGIFWVSSLYYRVEAQGKEIDTNKQTISKIYEKMEIVNRRLYRMEGRLNIKDREDIDGE